MSFFEELRRRNVFKVGIAYAVSAWVLLQIVDLVLENITAPEWVMQVFMLAVAIGFPFALLFAWAFEMTPDGLRLEKDVDHSQSISRQTGQRIMRNTAIALAIAVVLLLVDKFWQRSPTEPAPGADPTQQVVAAESAPAQSGKSIAVLPFADLSQARDQEWFADGLAEEILNVLAKTPDLLVSSRTSSFRYRDSTLDIPDIAQELGVAHVLEGSVRSSGDRIRVTAQLIRASDGFHLWSENYDRDVADMIEIQEDLAANIAKALETTMDPQALAEMTSVGTRSVAAYEAYLRGQALLVKSSVAADGAAKFLEAYEHFEKARAIDPGFAAAHLQAAEFWRTQLAGSRTDSGLTDLDPREIMLEFTNRIDEAIATAPTAIDSKGMMANKALFELRLRDSARLYREYLLERPNDNEALDALIEVALLASDSDLLLETLAVAKERGASDLQAAITYLNMAYRVLDASIAADFGLQALQRWPDANSLMYQTHRTMMWAGRIEEGKGLANRFSRLYPADDLLVRARQACAEGRRADAEAMLENLDREHNYSRSARWHILRLLGRDREAIEVLRPYADSGVPYEMASWLIYHKFDPAPYPSVMSILKREGINRPPAVQIPFKCPPPKQTSIAVLPFVNMSTDTENEFFSDGIAEEILNVLASIPDLKVAARTSAFAYKGTNTNISQIARELGVNHVLEGSVRKSGNQVRVTAQLIKADDGFHLWSENYDRELTNIFAIQDEIAGSIAEALKVSLELESKTAGNLTGTRSIEAYEHYLKGMSLWHQRTVASLYRSIEEFNAAIALDPGFAKAHAGLALAWSVIEGYITIDPGASQEKAFNAAHKALALDPDNVEALTALGNVAKERFNYEEAIGNFEKVIKLNPSFATAYQWMGGLLLVMGDPEAALTSYQKALSLDPRSRITGNNLALTYYLLDRRPEAVAVAQEVIGFAPDFPEISRSLMHLALSAGDCESVVRYGNRLAAILNKNVNATPVYNDLCQAQDSEARAKAVETILSWPSIEFSAVDNATLSYPEDIVLSLVDLGMFEPALTLAAKHRNYYHHIILTRVRSMRSANGIDFYCDSRVQALFEQTEIPPMDRENICD